tara:strand:- start:4089 stop:4463 length:375 start_codon:yes stop_codon:yes gene_type:complete
MSSPNPPKTITFISRSTPYGSGRAKACLDMVLSAAVFEQRINLVFMDDGVWQLQAAQQPKSIDAKDLSAALSALPLFEVSNIFAESEALSSRNLDPAALAIDVKACSAETIAALIRESDVVYQL